MKRVGKPIFRSQVSSETAQEMALVGIIPSLDQLTVGHRFTMAGQQFVITGIATRQEFLKAAEVTGLDGFDSIPHGYNFYRISTD